MEFQGIQFNLQNCNLTFLNDSRD